MRLPRQFLSRGLLAFGLAVLVFAYGYLAKPRHLFPSKQIETAVATARPSLKRLRGAPRDDETVTTDPRTAVIYDSAAIAPGLTLLAGPDARRRLSVRLIEPDGTVVRNWDLDWFTIYPNPTHVEPASKLPKSHPGATIHGLAISPNGDLTFNYEGLAMVQVDFCGRVRWRSKFMTHHAVERQPDGTFWVLDVRRRPKSDPTHPNLQEPFLEESVIQVDNDGRVLQRFPIVELLDNSGLQGLYTLGSLQEVPVVSGDVLHANDVEVFPAGLKPGLFQPGDIMVSLRNSSTIFVFDPKARKIRNIVTGASVRQHDPDFVDGDTISIFDNNNVGAKASLQSSRIVEYNFRTGARRMLFEGTAAHPFFTHETGVHQRLANGNILITEGRKGRVLEVTSGGKVVWEYYNHVAPDRLIEMTMAERLPANIWNLQYARRLAASCPAK